MSEAHMFSFISFIKRILFLRNRFIKISFLISCVLNFFLWVLLFWAISPPHLFYGLGLREKLEFFSLHYTIYFGVDWIGKWYNLFIFPGAGLLFFLINFFLTSLFYKKAFGGQPGLGKLLSYFLAGTAPAIQGLLLISFILVILINM